MGKVRTPTLCASFSRYQPTGKTLRHNLIHFTRWRQLQVPMEKDAPPHLKPAMDALDDLEADLVQQQRATAQPKPRRYEVVAE